MFAPAQQLDPLRMVQGTRNHRYDCPDLATLDRHITRLRHRISTVGTRSPHIAAAAAPTSTGCSTAAPGTPCPRPPPTRPAGSELTTVPPPQKQPRQRHNCHTAPRTNTRLLRTLPLNEPTASTRGDPNPTTWPRPSPKRILRAVARRKRHGPVGVDRRATSPLTPARRPNS